MCYYYDVKDSSEVASVGIYNPDIKKGLVLSYDKTTFDEFIEWKIKLTFYNTLFFQKKLDFF